MRRRKPPPPNTTARAGLELARGLSMPVLARTWQMLLKGLGEVRVAPSPLPAAEMILIRLAYAADLPPPADLVKQYQDERDQGRRGPNGGGPNGGGGGGGGAMASAMAVARPQPASQAMSTAQTMPAQALAAPEHNPGPVAKAEGNVVFLSPPRGQPASLDSFEAVVALFEARREIMLSAHLSNDAHLVSFEKGRIIVRLEDGARNRLREVAARLKEWTGESWVVDTSTEAGETTLGEKAREAKNALAERLKTSAPVRTLESLFPGIRLVDIRALSPRGLDGPLDEEPEVAEAHDEDAPILDIFDLEQEDD